MTEMLFREDAYLRDAQAKVVAHTLEGGLVLDKTVFYPNGGGQPGDSGELRWDNQSMLIATAIKGDGDEIVLIPAEPQGFATYRGYSDTRTGLGAPLQTYARAHRTPPFVRGCALWCHGWIDRSWQRALGL